jgi:hypothetical protein
MINNHSYNKNNITTITTTKETTTTILAKIYFIPARMSSLLEVTSMLKKLKNKIKIIIVSISRLRVFAFTSTQE